MRKALFLASFTLVFLVGVSDEATAQARPNNWATAEECLAAVKSGNMQWYEPTVLKRLPQQSYEQVLQHPTGACVLMDVPESIGGRRWIAMQSGTLSVYDMRVPGGGIVRMEKCDNRIYAEVPFGPGSRPLSLPPAVVNVRPDDEPAGGVTILEQAQERVRNQPLERRRSVDDDDDSAWGFLKSPWFLVPAAAVTGYVWRGVDSGDWWLIRRARASGCSVPCCGTCTP